MNVNQELNMQLFMRQEDNASHVDYSHEFGYYQNIVTGNIEEVRKVISNPINKEMYESAEFGKLSKDKIRNIRYHFVVSTALITRLCVENGLERELAYTLSDIYISKMDEMKTSEDIISLHNDMLMDFTEKMADTPINTIKSIHITKAIELIYKQRTKKLTVTDIAKQLGMNRSYLSKLFIEETGSSISSFIRTEKLKAASNMLKFSDYSYSDIAEYFGFSGQSHFIKCFKKEFGMTPKQYRDRYSK